MLNAAVATPVCRSCTLIQIISCSDHHNAQAREAYVEWILLWVRFGRHECRSQTSALTPTAVEVRAGAEFNFGPIAVMRGGQQKAGEANVSACGNSHSARADDPS
jgi:hypothetical protein